MKSVTDLQSNCICQASNPWKLAWSKILTLLYFFLVCAEFCLSLELPEKAMEKGDGKLMGMVLDLINLWCLSFLSKQKTSVLLKRHLKAKLCSFGK